MMGQSGNHHNKHERSFITSALERPPVADLGFQGHFHAPPGPTTEHLEPPPSPSLVGQGVTHELPPETHCPYGRWMLAVCDEHANERWVYRPCKKRSCRVCGVRRRKRVAWRIARGLELLSPEHGGGWFVGTWPDYIGKSTAVRTVARFVARLRRNSPHLISYACTWELTARGRLHVNLIFAPWTRIPQRVLSRWWQDVGGGKVVWIKRVGAGIGQEAAKSRQATGTYFAKFEQMVPTGRAATYSKCWPKLPETANCPRQGEIHFVREEHWYPWQQPPALIAQDVQLHLWEETLPGEYRNRQHITCNCFDHVLPIENSLPRSPPATSYLSRTL